MNEESKDLQSIQNLKGVGPKGASSLNNLGIFSISDAAFQILKFKLKMWMMKLRKLQVLN